MNRSDIITFSAKGVKTNSRGIKVSIPINNTDTSIYSIYPTRLKSTYDLEALFAILNKYKDQMKPDDIKHNSQIYAKCIDELDESPFGLFIDHHTPLPFTFNGLSLSATDNTNNKIYKQLYVKIQTMFDELYNLSAVNKTVKPPAATTEVAPTDAVPKVEAEAEAAVPVIAADDFDPRQWQKPIIDFEATKPLLEAEIKTLEETLASKFDIVTSNRLKKRKRMLEAFPTTLAILKANIVSKQNYYTDGYHQSYSHASSTLNNFIEKLDYLTELGHKMFTTHFNNESVIPHLARNPALFLKVETLVKDYRKKVNRLRVNKAEKETWVQNLEAAFVALKEKVAASKYYVKIPQDN